MFYIPSRSQVRDTFTRTHEPTVPVTVAGEESTIQTADGLVSVIYPEKGTYIRLPGHQVPFPGLPTSHIVFTLASLKQLPVLLLKTMFKKTGIVSRFGAALWLLKNRLKFASMALEFIYRGLKSHDYIPTKPKRLSRPVREVWRVLDLLIEREHDERVKQNFKMMRDVVCMVLEYDDAYRFRFQDVVSELNVSEIALDEIDRYWASRIKAYQFKFKSHD